MPKSGDIKGTDMYEAQHEMTEGGLLVPASKIAVNGKYHGQIIRAGRVIDEWEDSNLVTNEGLNALLNIMFNGATAISPWYLGIFEGNYTPLATVTAATITAASTECTTYVSATRPEFVEVAATAQSITNSASRASFVFNATKTIYGAFLVSNATKSATTGTLFSAARFGASRSVVADDELLLSYTFTAASV